MRPFYTEGPTTENSYSVLTHLRLIYSQYFSLSLENERHTQLVMFMRRACPLAASSSSDGPQNLQIEPKSFTYEVGDSLMCSADGNPAPTYKWTQIEYGSDVERTFDGPILVIHKAMLSDVQIHLQCTARNYVNGQWTNISENIVFTVTGLD